MKKKIFLLSCTAALISLTNLAQADVSIYFSLPTACTSLTGNWNGTANISSWIANCQYNGSGNIGAVDINGNFDLNINANKASGSILCPGTYSDHFSGKCTDGNVTISTGHGDLTGSLNGDGGSAKGTLNILGTQALLEIVFHKA